MKSLIDVLRGHLNPENDSFFLSRFCHDNDQAAFVELVRRYGSIVWGVCHRGLNNRNDAEDAFQATFLVLIKKANQLQPHESLGPWLYRVAQLTVQNTRKRSRRDSQRCHSLGKLDPEVSNSSESACDARMDVDVALAKLPEQYRVPVILCHLQGLSRRDAALKLGIPEGTLSATLAEALRRLRIKLKVKDITTVLAIAGAMTVPARLVQATSHAAQIFTATAVMPANVAGLTEGVLPMIGLKKWITAAVVITSMVVMTVGVGFATNQSPGSGNKTEGRLEEKEKPTSVESEIKQLEDQIQKIKLENERNKAEYELKKKIVEASEKKLHDTLNRLKQIHDNKQKKDGISLSILNEEAGAWGPRFHIQEIEKGQLYQYSCHQPASLGQLLKRLKQAGLSNLTVEADPKANIDVIEQSLVECQKSGFVKIKFKGPTPRSEKFGSQKGQWTIEKSHFEGEIELKP